MGLFRKPPRQRFAEEVLAAMQERVAVAWLDSDEFAIRYQLEASGEAHWMWLENSFHETRELSPSERAQYIQRRVSVSFEALPDKWDETRPLLRSVIRGITMGQGTPAAGVLSRQVLPFLAEFVVIDRPASMAYVNHSQMGEWGVDAAEVFDAARANLATMAASMTSSEPPAGPAIIRMVDNGDGYFTSMVLVDGFLAQLSQQVGGRPVAFIPERNTVIVARDDQEALPTLFELAEEEYVQAVRDVSPMAYTVDDAGAVVPYAAEEPGALADRVHRARLLLAAREYAAQTGILNAANERDGVDIFVGSLRVSERADGSRFSVAVWPEDVDSLLPEADFVYFPSESGGALVPWPIVASVAELRPDPEYAPPRYRVRDWPPAPAMRRLLDESVSA